MHVIILVEGKPSAARTGLSYQQTEGLIPSCGLVKLLMRIYHYSFRRDEVTI